MPYKVIGNPEFDPRRSLGKLVYWWIRNFVVYGPGSVAGEPVRLGPERISELVRMYALGANGKRLHDTAFLSNSKGTDKSGFAGYITSAEAVGPVRFNGWAKGGETYKFLGKTYEYQPGEPMGRPVNMPVIRCLATELDQSGNIYDVVLQNFQDGPLSELGLAAFDGYVDLGGGGKILPSTSGASSKDGGKETFVAVDETHLYTTPQLKSVYRTVRRNLTKRPLEEPWLLETTTMYEPGALSIAEETYAYAKQIEDGKARRSKLLFMHRYGTISEDDLGDEAKLRAALIDAMGDATEWMDPDATMDQIYDVRTPLSDSIRYFLNSLSGVAASWLSPQLIDLAVQRAGGEQLRDGDEIALGFDGSLTDDATALVAIRLRDNLVQLLHLQEPPQDETRRHHTKALWSVDQGAVDAAVADAMNRYGVKAYWADPPFFQELVSNWEKEWGDNLAPSTATHPIAFWTDNPSRMSNAVEHTHTLFTTGNIKLSMADPRIVRHLQNAREKQGRTGPLIYKEMKNSPKKIDAAMAMCIAVAASVQARTWTKKAKKTDPTQGGIIAQVPQSMLVPRFRS